MERHCENAMAVAAYLKSHPKVEKGNSSKCSGGRDKEQADTYLGGNYGGLMGVELKGGKRSGPGIHK